jgi:hypothetical protein
MTTVISMQDHSTRGTADYHDDLILEQDRKAEGVGVETLGLIEASDIGMRLS